MSNECIATLGGYVKAGDFVKLNNIKGIPNGQVRLVRINEHNELYVDSNDGSVCINNYPACHVEKFSMK